MTLLKIPFKIIALPIALAVTVVQWFGIFLASFAGAIFYIFSGLCFLIAVLGYLMGICTGTESVRTLVIVNEFCDDDPYTTIGRLMFLREATTRR